ncbi:MAG: NAD+ synthase, partial [Planctomycetota bacterium]
MKFALVQLNPTIGDVAGNVRRVLDALARERARGTDVAVFPELTLIGYPPRDLLLRPALIEANLKALQEAAAACEGIAAVVGFAEPNPLEGRPLYNAAAFLADRRVMQTFRKSLLPTYDVFDEDRYFEPSHETRIVQACGRKIGVSICEDIWNDKTFWRRRRYAFDPVQAQVDLGAEVLVNVSASPYHVGKERLRREMLANAARRHGRPVLYVNQVGGNDELVFDGGSLAIGTDGAVIARAAAFEEDAVQVDLAANLGEVRAEPSGELESVYRALVLGTRDYLGKCGFTGAVIGLSGGIDSALTACIAVDALGAANVLGVSMPSRYSSEHSKTDAEAQARNLGIRFMTVPIEEPFAAFLRTLVEPFSGREPDVTEENLQARIRGAVLMALSNKFSMLVLSTGNKSELAVGYCTLYGDMCG